MCRRSKLGQATDMHSRPDSHEGRNIQVVGSTAADGEARAALQAALLCQILQHNQLQAAHQENALLRELARTSAMQAEAGHGAQPTGPYGGTMEGHLQSRMEAWRAQRRAASRAAPGQGQAITRSSAQAGHGEVARRPSEQVWTPLPDSSRWVGHPGQPGQSARHWPGSAPPLSQAAARRLGRSGQPDRVAWAQPLRR